MVTTGEGCDENKLEGCNEGRCCKEIGACDEECEAEGFDFDAQCNGGWNTVLDECKQSSKCKIDS